MKPLTTIVAGLLTAAALLAATPARGQSTAACAPGADGAPGALAGIVNSYYPASADAVAGATAISLGALNGAGAATTLAPGDQLLVIQIQDAAIDSSDTDSYGDGVPGEPASGTTDAGATGAFEFACVTNSVGAGGGSVTLALPLVNTYRATGGSTFQVVRVPQYAAATLGGALTAAAWDGSSGGILAIDVQSILDFAGESVDVAGLGFRGGPSDTNASTVGALDFVTADLARATFKGEGIAGTPLALGGSGYPVGDLARGAPANAGGGGTGSNSGGGGGANCGFGGQGGNEFNTSRRNGGFGGAGFGGGPARLILGGGGGCGEQNNSQGSVGAAGGGIAMLYADTALGNGTVAADGDAAPPAGPDGGGGGGGGGSVLIAAAGGSLAGLAVSADGGDGADITVNNHGPGGGGGGGVIVTSSAVGSSSAAGGAEGTDVGGLTRGSSPGLPGNVGSFAAPPACPVGPPAFTKAFVPAIIASGGVSTLSFTIDNTIAPLAFTGLTFTDPLPAGVTVATPPNATTSCGGTVTAVAGGGTIDLAGGTVAANASCTVSVDVTSATLGMHLNTTDILDSDQGRVGTASATLEVIAAAPPGFAKVFAPDTIPLAGISTLTFTVDNTANAIAVGNLAFVDPFPIGILIASPPNATNTCGGTLAAAGGSPILSLTGGIVPATSTCTIAVEVEGTAPGMHVNVSSDLTSDAGNSGPASDTLTVVDQADLSLDKTAMPDPVHAGATVTYTLTVANAGPSDAQNVQVTETLPAGVTFGETLGCLNDPAGVPVCDLGTVGAGTSVAYLVIATVETSTGNTTLTNQASVASSTPDPTPGNDLATVDTEVQFVAIEVPTLGQLGLVLLALLLAALGSVLVRRARTP